MIEPSKGRFKAPDKNAGLGRHKVTWENEPCVEKGAMEEESRILITTCPDDQFTCE